jgi:hypothetical protein
MNCNDFNPSDNNGWDIVCMKDQDLLPIVMKWQGDISSSSTMVRNIYGAPWNNSLENKWYVEPASSPETNQEIVHGCHNFATSNPNYTNNQASTPVWVIPVNVAFSWSSVCPEFPGYQKQSSLAKEDNLTNLNDYIIQKQESCVEDENDFEIQAAVSSKLNLFLCDSMAESIDSVINILAANQGRMTDADIQLIFAFMKKGDFTSAESYISELPSDRSDWKELFGKLIEIEQDSLGIYSLIDNSTNKEYMLEYAASEGKDGQTSAQALLRLVFEIEHEYPIILPQEEGERPVNAITGVHANNGNEYVKIFPNPVAKNVTIKASNSGILKVEVLDLVGKTVLTNFINSEDENYISLSELSNGMYLIKISTSDNKIVLQDKIVKQQ